MYVSVDVARARETKETRGTGDMREASSSALIVPLLRGSEGGGAPPPPPESVCTKPSYDVCRSPLPGFANSFCYYNTLTFNNAFKNFSSLRPSGHLSPQGKTQLNDDGFGVRENDESSSSSS